MVPDDPRVVLEIIEQIDHQLALAAPSDVGALINITNVDQDRVWILPPPPADLRNAARQPTEVRISIVIGGRQNMAVDVRCVQDRDANSVGVERRCRLRQTGNCADQSGSADGFYEIASSPGSVRMKHRLNFRACRHTNGQPTVISMKMLGLSILTARYIR